MKKTAKLISYIFTPTTFALIAFLVLSYFVEQPSNKHTVAAVSVLFGAILPFGYILFLLRRESVTHLDVPIREQRTGPYVVSVLIYAVGFLVLYFMKAAVPVCALMFCYATNTLVVAIINTRSKISAHAMGASGPLTLLVIVFGWKVLPAFLLVIIISWARVELKAHTKAQVTAGTLLGILLTAIQAEVLFSLSFPR